MRCVPQRLDQRENTEPADQRQAAEAEHRCVKGITSIRVHGPDWTNGRQGREQHGGEQCQKHARDNGRDRCHEALTNDLDGSSTEGAKNSGQRRQPPSAPLKGAGADRIATARSNPTSSPSPLEGSIGSSTDLGGGGGAAPLSAAVGQRKAIYCGWCGESTPGNRGLSHDCGSKDRPMTSCRFCGKPFADGADSCSECFA